jgi:glutamate synthase domain-containing protein 2
MNPPDVHRKCEEEPLEAPVASETESSAPPVRERERVPSPHVAAPEPRHYQRFHLATSETPGVRGHPSRFRVHVRKRDLVGMVLRELFTLRGPGRVQVAMSRPCVYGVFGRPVGGLAPVHDKCVGCLRCTTQYPHMVQIVPDPARLGLGDDYLRPEHVDTIHYEATTGRVPVRGAGYRGAFGGAGWDGMWTDMSEIVRPTRDGIHGREFISTTVDLGSKPLFLRFDPSGEVAGEAPHIVALEVPFLFDAPPEDAPRRALQALAAVARRAGTLAVLPATGAAMLPAPEVVPLLPPGGADSAPAGPWRLVELEGWDEGAWRALCRRFPAAIVAVRIPVDGPVLGLVERGVRVFHLTANYHGRVGAGFVGDALRAVHAALVDAGVRDRVTLVLGGGVVQAEHVPKAIISGADAVALDTAAWAALQVRFMGRGIERSTTRVRFPRFSAEWGAQRLTNLAASWRDQLLEVLGAMGLREVRRLRGELGRCMLQADLEQEAFGGIAAGAPSSPPPSRRLGRVHLPVFAPRPERGHAPSRASWQSVDEAIVAKHRAALDRGLELWPRLAFRPPALGDARWPADLILATWEQASSGKPPANDLEYRIGRSGGGFDVLDFRFAPRARWVPEGVEIDTAIPLNRRPFDARIEIPVPWYGGGMSYGSVSEQVMLARAMCAARWRTFTSTGEGGYPESLAPLAASIITQIATGMFGVREQTIARAPILEFKYAQGAKPGLGGHLLGDKATTAVAKMRESVPWVSLFSPFPFHSVYSVEDHKKHIDWVRSVNPTALVSVKVSTPTDVDMVAVGSYHAGAHIIHIDGSYGGTGAAPEIAKKNIAMPIELAIPRVHSFLEVEGIRDEVVLIASGGLRTAWDVAKAIALGADGCVLGTAELVAIGCTRCSNCERGRGCPFGLTTTDPELSRLVTPEWAGRRLSNLYAAFRLQLVDILRRLGLTSVRELRGRTDLLAYTGRGA